MPCHRNLNRPSHHSQYQHDPMDTEPINNLWERAEADAAKIAPRPRIEPLTAAIGGGVGTFIALEVFWLLADLPRDRYALRRR
jgi:hypothetical protein